MQSQYQTRLLWAREEVRPQTPPFPPLRQQNQGHCANHRNGRTPPPCLHSRPVAVLTHYTQSPNTRPTRSPTAPGSRAWRQQGRRGPVSRLFQRLEALTAPSSIFRPVTPAGALSFCAPLPHCRILRWTTPGSLGQSGVTSPSAGQPMSSLSATSPGNVIAHRISVWTSAGDPTPAAVSEGCSLRGAATFARPSVR